MEDAVGMRMEGGWKGEEDWDLYRCCGTVEDVGLWEVGIGGMGKEYADYEGEER